MKRTSRATASFYDHLVTGKIKRNFLGVNKRYKTNSRIQQKFLERYFDKNVSRFIERENRVLDFGCGSGIFSRRIARCSGYVEGVDISHGFIKLAESESSHLQNVEFHLIDDSDSFFNLNIEKFDILLCVDVIHHLENPLKQLDLPLKTLKQNGKVLIYEPNLLNPIIFLMHLLDPNERSLMKLGTRKRYRRILEKYDLQIEHIEYNGIVIGPANHFFWLISKFLEIRIFRSLRWLNPKIFIYCTKKV
jgi:2-polyprenyl-3-methyl-5-hydroxy-6-metoxy-1,4-benzoquinol methylase